MYLLPYEEIQGLKWRKKDKEKAVRRSIDRRQKLTYGHYFRHDKIIKVTVFCL